MPEPTLTTRQREILVAIVENYIATGEPVSSGAVAACQPRERRPGQFGHYSQ